ncbi:MAG: carbohydrate ABC transporter permease [Firmicutes bacterium]|nr:carbohydrate ABC transporter permease [Bacillota bacterium]
MQKDRLPFIKRIKPLWIVLLIVLVIYTVVLLLPLFWGLFASLKSVDEFRLNIIGLPKDWAFDNYPFVLRTFEKEVTTRAGEQRVVGTAEMFLNTVLYVGGCSLLSAASPFLMAYLNVKFKYKFNNVIYGVVIVTMMLPIVGALPSELRLLNLLKIYNTWYGIFIQSMGFLGIYFLVFHASFRTVSNELSEAAYVDGASEFRAMIQIVMPLARGAFFTVLLILSIGRWNDYQGPLIYLPSHPTLAVGLFDLSRSLINDLNHVPMRMAGCCMLMLPILVLFMLFHKKLMGNLQFGGLKE